MITQKPKKRKSQCDRVAAYLEDHAGATNLEISTALRISSASKRISDLRKLGLVDTIWDEATNEFGETVRFCRYYLRREANA